VAVPVLIALWFAPLKSSALWCAALFVAASFTDWLDGYIARKVSHRRLDGWIAHLGCGLRGSVSHRGSALTQDPDSSP